MMEENAPRNTMGVGSALRQFLRQAAAGLRVFAIATLVLGLAYPTIILGIGLLMPSQANGSLLNASGEYVQAGDQDVVGSGLVGQEFEGEEWFHSRPSAAGDGYDAMNSAASNKGPNDPDLVADIAARRAAIAAEEGVVPSEIPADALTASASGLDPDISLEYAELQSARIMRVRGLPEDAVRKIIAEATSESQLGVLGTQRVNVLLMNIALEREVAAIG